MGQTLTIQLEKPIVSAKLPDEATIKKTPFGNGNNGQSGGAGAVTPSELYKKSLPQACQALQDAAKKVIEFQENVFKEHKEEIAKLAVEIARKILRQEIDKGNYEIEAIVKETLENSPTSEHIVVHLNPDDLVEVQKTVKDGAENALINIKLVGDVNIKRAECVLETPKGIIESFIDVQLERIGEALKNAG